MLPPVSGPAVPLKASTTQIESPQGAQSGLRTSLGTATAEAGPAKLKPETLRAIDPSRQSEGVLRVTTDSSDQTDTRPAGPPPAFIETLLERQARVALDPPDAKDVPIEEAPPAGTAESQAEASFAETRAIATQPTEPQVDRKE